MDKFKVGDKVYITEEGWSGRVVELHENTAFVEFTTPGGGGCLGFELSELEHENKMKRLEEFGMKNNHEIDKMIAVVED